MAVNNLTVGAFLLLMLANIPTQATNSRFTTMPMSALNKAMLGVDPVQSNPLGKKDPGLKNQIFIPVLSLGEHSETIVINNFIGKAVQDVRCERVSSASMKTVSNFNSYRKMMTDSISFNAGGGISAQYMGFGGGVHVGFGSGSDTSDENHQKFFQQTEGEIILGGAECQTHVVSVDLNAKPVFTENFVIGLRKLDLAAQDPSSGKSIQTFYNFVDNFGTHFQDTTILGSKLIIEKLFEKKAVNTTESSERQRCVSSSFTQSFQVNVPFVEAEAHFSQDANKCSGSQSSSNAFNSLGLSSERIITVGTPPYSDPDKWAEHALQTPVPIRYKLEKISHMFVQDWFDDYVTDEKFNGTAMRDFFENHSGKYCEIMLGRPCTAACGDKSYCRLEEKCVKDNTAADGFICRKGCGITSDCRSNQICVPDTNLKGFRCEVLCFWSHLACSPGESCHAEPHSARGFICVPTKPGRAVIAGGSGPDGSYDSYSFTGLKEVESLNYKAFPDLPRAVYSNAMAKAGDYLYTCGGKRKVNVRWYEENDDCYHINVHNPGNEWQEMQSIPIKVLGSAVSVGNTLIWFFDGLTLVKFDADKNLFTTTILPFDSRRSHCSVSNGTHAYVIGAGSERREIWTNKIPMDETEWELAGHLMRSRFGHACLWYGSNLMTTGGDWLRSDVELFNTETREVWGGKELPRAVVGHRMMLHNGMPTVVGGCTRIYNCTSRIISFSITENRWIESSMKLNNPKSGFALVEV